MADANQDYYKILGVSRSVSKTELKKAYHRLARKHHPDVNRSADAEATFKRINEAYEVLSNKKRRAAYDQVSRNWERDGRPAYYDSSILDEFIASYFDAKGDIQRQRACLFNCPHCSGETTVFFDYAVLNWQNFLKQCDVCKNFILIDYEVRKGKVSFFEARPRGETVRS